MGMHLLLWGDPDRGLCIHLLRMVLMLLVMLLRRRRLLLIRLTHVLVLLLLLLLVLVLLLLRWHLEGWRLCLECLLIARGLHRLQALIVVRPR